MITIHKKIDSGSLWLLAVCILSLVASPANPAARAGGLPLPVMISSIDPPELPIPKPPPPPEIPIPPPYQGTAAMEQTA